MIPVIVTLFICVICCMAAFRIAQQERLEEQEKTAQYFIQNLDTQMKSVKSYSYEILNSQYMTNLSRAYSSGAEEQQNRAETTLMSNIYQYCTTIKLADNILLYYPAQDRIISKYGSLTAYQYFLVTNEELLDHPQLYEERFNSVFDRKHGEIYTVVNPFSGVTECYYFACVPSNSTLENCNWAMALKLSPYALAQEMADMAEVMNMEFVALATRSGNVFSRTDLPKDFLKEKDLLMSETQLLEKLSGHDYIKSDESLWGMDLYFVYDDTDTYNYLENLSKILFGGLVLASLLGIALALVSHTARERQIGSLVDRLGGEKGTALDKAVTDFLENAYQENVQNIQIIDRQRILVRYSFLKELLRTHNLSEDKLEAFYTAYDMNFENDGLSIFAMPWDQTGKAREKSDVVTFLLENGMGESVVFWTRIENIDVFLCNYTANKDSRTMIDAFRQKLQDAFSGQCHGSGIQFDDALSCIREFRHLYQVITGRKFVAYGTNTNKVQSVYQKLIDALSNDDLERQHVLISQICQQLQTEENNNQNLSKRYAFLHDLYRLPQMQAHEHVLDEMFRDMRSQTWIRCLLSLLPEPDELEHSDQVQKRVAQEVVKIISEEYNNPQMSLSILSERLDVSQSYLSRVFKQEYGENISHYLSKTRVERAKMLMCNGDENLNAIALQVGFLSDMNFIRVFKKLENETPGNFRKKSKLS